MMHTRELKILSRALVAVAGGDAADGRRHIDGPFSGTRDGTLAGIEMPARHAHASADELLFERDPLTGW